MISRRTGVGAPIPSGVGCPLHSAQGLSRNWGAGAATRRLVATAPGGDSGACHLQARWPCRRFADDAILSLFSTGPTPMLGTFMTCRPSPYLVLLAVVVAACSSSSA